LTWEDHSTTEDGFEVERCAGDACGSFVKIGQTNANVVTFSDSTVGGSTSYSYRVRAFNASGASDYSNTGSVTTPAAPQLHIGDLDGSTSVSKNTWTASVTMTVHNDGHAAVGATVSGTWSGGYSATASCATTAAGTCKVSTANLNKSKTSATFTVTNVAASGLTYSASANHDPDGDSNGTSITMLKP
jgi:serine protease AprX